MDLEKARAHAEHAARYAALGDSGKRGSHARRARHYYRAHFGGARHESFEEAEGYVEALLSEGRYQEAESEARSLRGTNAQETTRAEAYLAVALTHLGRAGEAEQYLVRLSQSRNNPHAVGALAEIASALVTQGNHAQAAGIFERVDAELKLLPEEKALPISLLYAKTLRQCGKHAGAIVVLERIIKKRPQVPDYTDTHRLHAALELALARFDTGRETGLEEVRSAVNRMVQALTENNVDALRARAALARALFDTKKLANMEEAEKLMQRVVAGMKTALGEDHKETLRSSVDHGIALASIADAKYSDAALKAATDNLKVTAEKCRSELGETNETTLYAENAVRESRLRKNLAALCVNAPVITETGRRGKIVGVSDGKRRVEVDDDRGGKREIEVDASELRVACYNPACSEGRRDLQRCNKCLTAQYCCRECQKADWKRHKPECKPFDEKK